MASEIADYRHCKKSADTGMVYPNNSGYTSADVACPVRKSIGLTYIRLLPEIPIYPNQE